MASRDRFISHKEFGALIADLHLAQTIFQDGLLEFLERQRIVVPVVRVRWPASMVIDYHEGVADPAPTQTERDATLALSDALRLWRRFDADPEQTHPFDLGTDAPGAMLITTDLLSQATEKWTDFRINIRGPGQEPLYVTDGVDTYYHAWQILLVADALEMGVHLVFDTRLPELLKLAMIGKSACIPEGVAYGTVSFEGPRGLTKGLEWAPYFDAVARVEAVRSRKLAALARGHGGQMFPLQDTE